MTGEEQRLALIGEDVYELLGDLRSSFWVEFDRNDIVECCTVGELFDRVWKKMGAGGAPGCVTSGAFYRVRRMLAEERGMEHRAIRVDTPLQDLMPWWNRRTGWASIETKLRVSLPALQPGAGLMLGMLVCALGMGVWITGQGQQGGIWRLALVLFWTVMGWGVGLIVTRGLHRDFPEKIRTVGDLARVIASRNHAKLAAELGGTSAAQAWRSFQELVSSAAGMRAEMVRREMRFPEDLRIY